MCWIPNKETHKIWYICENANEPSPLEGKVAYGLSLNEDTDWNESGPQEYIEWNGFGSQEDNGWMDYLVCTTRSDGILCQ